MELNSFKWRKLEELPMDKEMTLKVILLVENDSNIHSSMEIVTDRWTVCIDRRYVDWKIFQKVKHLSNGNFSYGKFDNTKYKKYNVKAWAYADDLIEKYCNERNYNKS